MSTEASQVGASSEPAGGAAGGSEAPASPSPELLTKARSMGWVPKEEFRGDKAKWIDAGAYVERGETLLPLLQADRRQLQEQVRQQSAALAQKDKDVAELRNSIEELKKFNTEINKDRVRANRTEIAKQIKEAREAGDVERELELQDQLAEANSALRTSSEKPTAKAEPASGTPAQPALAPEYVEWAKANPWFGAQGEERRTNFAMATAQHLRATTNLTGKAFYDKVSEEVSAVFEPKTRGNGSKVEGGTGSSGTPGGGTTVSDGKSFADLPAEAKAVCQRQASKFVGKNKAFATEAEWQKHYAQQYFS